MRHIGRGAGSVLLTALLMAPGADAGAAQAASHWLWPVPAPHPVLRAFEAPPSPYAAGHRGIDIGASPGAVVVAVAAGSVSFAGVVVDRPIVTLRTADGTLVSMEPVTTTRAEGDPVGAGDVLGRVGDGGHCSGRCVHLGVRVAGEYVSPLLFLGGVPRAVLLPVRPGDVR